MATIPDETFKNTLIGEPGVDYRVGLCCQLYYRLTPRSWLAGNFSKFSEKLQNSCEHFDLHYILNALSHVSTNASLRQAKSVSSLAVDKKTKRRLFLGS